MFERLMERAHGLAGDMCTARIERLAGETPPPGITITRSSDGVILSGRRLRRRFVTDATVRSFGR